MNRKMMPYYISRMFVAIFFGLLLYFTGSSILVAVLACCASIAFFLWAPHSNRYSVHPEFGITALRRDERTQIINDKAARNAFVVIMFLIGAISLYFGSLGALSLSISILKILLIAGVLTYYISDFWMRNPQH